MSPVRRNLALVVVVVVVIAVAVVVAWSSQMDPRDALRLLKSYHNCFTTVLQNTQLTQTDGA